MLDTETERQRRAEVSANFVKIGKHNHRLKVYNRGAGIARNVRLEVLSGEDLLAGDDLREKFPVPALEQHQTVELLASVHLRSPRRSHVILHWDDDTAQGREKEL